MSLSGIGRFYKSHEKKILAGASALIGGVAAHYGVLDVVINVVKAIAGSN